MEKNWNVKLNKTHMGLIAGISVLIVVLAVVFWIQPEVVVEELVVEAGSPMPEPRAFLLEDTGEAVDYADNAQVDLTKPGSYPVELSYREDTHKSTIVVRDTVAPTGTAKNLLAYSTQTVKAEDFLVTVEDVTQVTASFEKEPDLSRTGSRLVTIVLTDQGGNVARVQAVLTVLHDTTPPELTGVAPQYTYLGTKPEYTAELVATDDYDLNPEIIVDDSKVKLDALGTYDLVFRAVDEVGNETRMATTLTVTDDNVPPAIYGVHEIAVYMGSTLDYTSGIVVSDDRDNAPKLTVDSSRVDLNTPGTYPLAFQVRDRSGNVTRAETTVRIEEKPAQYTQEADITAAVDAVLVKITTPDMTPEAKVRAIYSYIRSNYTYAGSTVRTDEMQAAYELIQQGRGDCFHFFSLGKLMLNRAGVQTIDVRKVKNHDGDTDHYWSMVSVDGGESWYHFDATPYPWDPTDFCLVTDSFVESFSKDHKGYFNRDTALYPATPEN